VYFNYTYKLLFIALFDDFNLIISIFHCLCPSSTDNDIFWIQDIIILYDHNTYFLSSPVCQACLIDLYRKMTDQFRPELFDDSVTCSNIPAARNIGVTNDHGYVPFFVIQSGSFIIPELSPGLQKDLHDGLH
jgi:hypothetical protein